MGNAESLCRTRRHVKNREHFSIDNLCLETLSDVREAWQAHHLT